MILAIFLFYLFVYLTQSACTLSAPYLLVSTNVCYAECPWNPPTQYYASSFDNTCVTTCPTGWYGFDGNKTCLQLCPTTPNMTFYDTVNSKCVTSCPANYFAYLGAASDNQKCVATCPSGTFAQQLNRQCVTTCPSNTFYKNDTTPKCVTRCPDNYYGSPLDKNCKIGGSCPTTPVMYFSDDTTNLCVQKCPNNTFADITTGRCLVFCSSGYFADKTTWRCVQNCPTNYFRSNVTKSCLLTCTEGYFIDKQTGNCTQTCTTGTFGDFATGFCEEECTYPTFSDSVVGRCVNTCSFGLYADNFTQKCVTQTNCYSNWIGDPTTRKCVEPSNCPTTPYHYANLVAKICTPKCPPSLWGDKSTKSCVSVCPWNPKTYVSWKNPDTQECATKCPQFPILYADNSTQTCVSQCPAQSATVPYDTYADDISQSCVRVCPNGFKSQKPQYICISQCFNTPTVLYFFHVNSSCISGCPEGYYADPSRQLCVKTCPTSPAYFSLETDNTCVDECPPGLFADSSTRKCVEWCPQTTLQYADDSTNECVDVCPLTPDYFGLDRIDGNRVCVGTCDVGLFADPITRTCVPQCNIEEGYYGQLLTPVRRCVLECPTSKFADNVTKTCVSKCPNVPVKYFGNSNTKKCQLTCPQFLYGNSVTNVCGLPKACQTGFFADDLTNKCVKTCPQTQQTFGQPTSRRCLKTCPQGKFADNTTRKCETNCNATAKLYKDPSTNRCVMQCPATPNLYNDPFTMTCEKQCSNGWFAYDGTRKCVQICPSTPAFFGNVDTFRCVATCPVARYKFVTNTERSCRPYCPASYMGTLYADNTTWSCVAVCPEKQNLYAFKHPDDATVRTCVKTCPMVNDTVYYFSDNVTQSCVTQCPLKNLTWGDTFSLKCERNCTRNQFRDNSTFRCTYTCSAPLFADNTTWDCVKTCPLGTFAFASGTNRTCLRQCPTGFYADNKTKFCRSLCDHDVALWSDNTTWECVKTCPTVPDLYADPNSDKCEFACSLELFADKAKRKCVTALQCSPGTIGDPTTYRCITRCPIEVPSFWQVSSNTCVTRCPDGTYADNSTMKCQATCSAAVDFWAYNHTTLGPICVLYCPATYYRHLPNRTCLTACPAPDYFRDTTTMKCVKTCPDHYFAETIGQVCVANCSVNGKYGLSNVCYTGCTGEYNADPTTYLCVKQCPFIYFSELNICTQTCSIGYADPITKVCQPSLCSPGYYAQKTSHKCIQDCQPLYKYDANQTCLSACPVTSSHLTNLYMDNNSYSCVNQCLPGWYADNSTGYCNTQCTLGLFADNSTGRCVSKCPSTPDFFGYQKVCHFPCPAPGLYAQNNTRQCLNVCPTGGFADDYNRRCMDICTKKQYAHSYTNAGVTYNVCVDMCPEGFFASDKLKACVSVCDEGTYGENDTNKCLGKCPTGAFADEFLNLCVIECDAGRAEFKDWSTARCVKECPATPSLYAQNSSRSCVAFCNIGWYGLNTTRVCTQNCPSPFFADPSTGFCQEKCHIGTDRFADNISRSCVLNCPNFTDPSTNKLVITYEDNSTKTCVRQCPFFPSLYGYNATNACVEDCPATTFGDNDTRLCLEKCFFDIIYAGAKKYTWADSQTGFCTKQCTKGTFADNFTASCTNYCTEGTFADNSTWRCVYMCPTNPISFARLSTRQCVSRCDKGLFGDQISRKCLTYCPKEPYYYYKDHQTQRCAKNCTTSDNQYFAEDLSQSCVTECTIGYFRSLSQHKCVKCPSSCLTCFALLNCTSCQPGLYLHDGQCIQSCPTFPIRYYANDLSSACTKQCPMPYFGFNGTGKCQLTCPQKYFSDLTDNTCKLCFKGCKQCLTQTNCTSCLTGYIHVPQYNTCSKVCNTTHIYFVQGKCSLTCVEGTFLLSDLVTCQKCSTACATCSLTGNNCTKCNNKFWYSYNCVTQCPEGFYANSDSQCVDCKTNAAACSVKPLTYGVETFTKDYKVFAFVKFNRPIQLNNGSKATPANPNVSNVAKVSSSVRDEEFVSVGASVPATESATTNLPLPVSTSDNQFRSVGASQEQMQNFNQVLLLKTAKGPIKASNYRATKYNQTTFLVQFYDASSLNEMALTVDFTPGSIVDEFGNGLTKSSDVIQIQTLSTVSVQTQQQAIEMKQNVNVLSWILVALLLLMMINCSYPLIVLLDFLQLVYMHLYIEINPLPYLWMHIMAQLENLNFAFLPQIYKEQSDNSAINPFYLFKKDVTMLGNVQPLVYVGGVFVLIYLLFWGLSSLRCNCCKWLRRKAKKVFRSRMKFSLFNQIFYYTQLYVVFFAVLQWPKNRSQTHAGANLAVSIIAFTLYISWLVFLLYKSSHYRNTLTTIPKRYKFLTLEPSQFPLDLAIRYMLKLFFCISLLITQKSVQLVLLIIINLVYFFFTLIYKPAVKASTNYINMFVSLGLIAYEVSMFVYGLGDKTAGGQQSWSMVLLGIVGAILAVIVMWVLYRFGLWVKVDVLGIKGQHTAVEVHQGNYTDDKDYNNNRQIEQSQSTTNQNVFSFFNPNKLTSKPSAKPKSQYNQIASDLSKSILDQDQQDKSVKNMLPELQFNKYGEDDDNDSEPQINEDEIMNEFAYHMVPKKHDAVVKAEKKVMEKNQDRLGVVKGNKKRTSVTPLVISIDEDELIDKNIQIVFDSKPKNVKLDPLPKPVIEPLQKPNTIQQIRPSKIIFHQPNDHEPSQIEDIDAISNIQSNN